MDQLPSWDDYDVGSGNDLDAYLYQDQTRSGSKQNPAQHRDLRDRREMKSLQLSGHRDRYESPHLMGPKHQLTLDSPRSQSSLSEESLSTGEPGRLKQTKYGVDVSKKTARSSRDHASTPFDAFACREYLLYASESIKSIIDCLKHVDDQVQKDSDLTRQV